MIGLYGSPNRRHGIYKFWKLETKGYFGSWEEEVMDPFQLWLALNLLSPPPPTVIWTCVVSTPQSKRLVCVWFTANAPKKSCWAHLILFWLIFIIMAGEFVGPIIYFEFSCNLISVDIINSCVYHRFANCQK